MNETIAYLIGGAFTAIAALGGLYLSLRQQAVAAEHRQTKSEQQITDIVGRLDRERDDSKEFRQRIEAVLTEQTRILRELAEKIK